VDVGSSIEENEPNSETSRGNSDSPMLREIEWFPLISHGTYIKDIPRY
jgi:hypothetical protein